MIRRTAETTTERHRDARHDCSKVLGPAKEVSAGASEPERVETFGGPIAVRELNLSGTSRSKLCQKLC